MHRAADHGQPTAQLMLPFDADLPEILTCSQWCQRWHNRRHSWRRVRDGGFDARLYEVHPIDEDMAETYVPHHYSRSYPAAARRFGLFDVAGDAPGLAGVAVCGIPVQKQVLRRALPTLVPYAESQELSRFILDDQCPANAESWILARCFNQLLAAGIRNVVSFADPVPRRAADGTLTAVGHVGTIYQATNASYTGCGTARTLTLLPDGTVLNDRAAQKVRRQEQGHEYVEQKLVALGASVPRRTEPDTLAPSGSRRRRCAAPATSRRTPLRVPARPQPARA